MSRFKQETPRFDSDAQPDPASDAPLLQVRGLAVTFPSENGRVHAVRGVDLDVRRGEVLALVGESGSGKSVTSTAVMGLLDETASVSGSVRLHGTELLGRSDSYMSQLRGSQIAMVFQDPLSALTPVYTVGQQIIEALKIHRRGIGDKDARKRAVELLDLVGIPNPEVRINAYPHEFSGGMRQRALIAIGLAARPDLLIADEPTSALDVTVQRRILDHLQTLVRELGTAMLFVTHDLGLAAERAEHIVVMHRGRVVESGPSLEVLQDPRHPYTQRLVKAAPSLASRRIESAHARGIQVTDDELLGASLGSSATEEILRVEHLTKVFEVRGAKGKDKALKAVDDVSFCIRKGTTTALVGESGSGKSTVANIILNLIDPTSGKVFHDGVDLSTLGPRELFALRRIMQPVFQNPYGSLDPMYSIFRVIEEPLRVHGIGTAKEREARVAELLDMVSLPRSVMRRYPHELSGGQRQRVAIARALALKPEIVVLDEAVSALDVLVQAQILRLLSELQAELELTYLFITHDLAVVRQIADDVVVMEHGRIVEAGAADELFANPRRDYTRELIQAVPGAGIDLYSDETADETVGQAAQE